VERLKAQNEALTHDNARLYRHINGREDARLDASVAVVDENAQLRARVRELEEAMRPFAAYYHHSQSRMDGRMLSRRPMPDEPGYMPGDELGLTHDDFLRARKALGGEGE
jgi:hypothetical protein